MNYKILVNKNHKITKSDLNNINLIEVKNELEDTIYIEKKTYQMYLKLKDFLKTIGIEIGIQSAYRKTEEQEQLIEKLIKKKKKDYIEKYVAPPSYTEHHTALAIDLMLKEKGKFLVTEEELLSKEFTFQKIHFHLKEFGFILRYPKEKEKITGYSYKPWHIRYVGKKTAMIMDKENLCLEEYHEKYNINGILVINKPSGLTSREIDEIISRKFDTKKIGHTGTLDPLASGVLLVAINKATKICQDIVSEDKEYIATVRIGIQTDTLDITGKILEETKERKKIDFAKVLKSFEKTYMQEVPIYSAVKVNGKKLYQYARNGEKVVLPKKEVTIKKIQLLEEKDDQFSFQCTVSKGTYIRSLIRDIGKSIDLPMTMQSLIRIRESNFKIEESYNLEQIQRGDYKIIPIEEVLNYKIIDIEGPLLNKVKNGAMIPNTYKIKDKVIFKNNNQLIAIYQKKEYDNNLKSYKNF